jgi:hypothetical protein
VDVVDDAALLIERSLQGRCVGLGVFAFGRDATRPPGERWLKPVPTTGQPEEKIRGAATRCRSVIGFLLAVGFSSSPLESIPAPRWQFRRLDDKRYFYEPALDFPPHTNHSGGPTPAPLPERRIEIQLSRSDNHPSRSTGGCRDIAGNIMRMLR